jgi:hypothetical protein
VITWSFVTNKRTFAPHNPRSFLTYSNKHLCINSNL